MQKNLKWQGSAPSNIALIKYMGKLDYDKNIPSNPSLSYTLENLRTFVEIELSQEFDTWEPLQKEGCSVSLSDNGQRRFINHFKKLKDAFAVKEYFVIRSNNNFPSDSGLASSASSFAALTITAAQAFEDLGYKNNSGKKLYELSREGSGSSCRSFFSPWALWNKEEVFGLDIRIKNLIHEVIVVDSKAKEVSSGVAHKRIQTSLLNQNRSFRVTNRLSELIESFNSQDWRKIYEICWAEFWDMHALFETSMPSFRYMTGESLVALQRLDGFWKENNDGPIVTMDAGANVHTLWREDQKKLLEDFKSSKDIRFLSI